MHETGTDGVSSTEVVIELPEGLHARPAAEFVQRAGEFGSVVTVRHGERSADAKSVLMVLSLAAECGARVRIEAEGPDAADAVRALGGLLAPSTA